MGLGPLVGVFRGLSMVMHDLVVVVVVVIVAAVLNHFALVHVALMAAGVLIDEMVAAEEAMVPISHTGAWPSLVLSKSRTDRAHASGVDKTYMSMRTVCWTTCCPYHHYEVKEDISTGLGRPSCRARTSNQKWSG